MNIMIKKIQTKIEHETALAEIEEWMCHQERPRPIHLDSLIDAVVNYEKIHYPIGHENETLR